jgi:uncharacterized surface protein with fasciclin (FAS1) repeats
MKRIIFAAAGGIAALALSASAFAADVLPAPNSASTTAQQGGADIVDTAIAAGDFTTLVAAVQAAGLVDTLRGDGPFTVFAPTDAAFAALPAGTVDSLLANPDQLRQVLLYHVVAGEVLAADVVGLTSATTAQGSSVPIQVSGSTVRVGGANVVATDVMASNGVIHVIDAVLIPPTPAQPAQPAQPAAPITPPAAGSAGLLASEGGSNTGWLLAGLAGLAALAVAVPTGVRFAKARRSS